MGQDSDMTKPTYDELVEALSECATELAEWVERHYAARENIRANVVATNVTLNQW